MIISERVLKIVFPSLPCLVGSFAAACKINAARSRLENFSANFFWSVSMIYDCLGCGFIIHIHIPTRRSQKIHRN